MRGLPPGFRFEPTEEELVFEYLKCKVFSFALPASIIPEITTSVCNLDPWDIPGGGGDWQEDTYLFSKNQECDRRVRWSPSGYWKAKGSERKIVSSSSDAVGLVGMRKTLVFWMGSSSSRKTGWVMHEYRLLLSPTQPPTPPSVVINNMEKWVVCRIFCNNSGIKNDLHFHPLQCPVSASTNDDTNALSDDSASSTASSSSFSATTTMPFPNHHSSASN
ncbi:NAC domain-containing protein 83 isoform X1 [Cucurbita moschata]|uniref:NAC domain-containing protein 83 isoform X1 n=1 Tax=Cucurbita moschata TaxID=3662 RepID=A0A6J1E5M7_CUCMO|nr:NAC domain-containing protein 83 isoform X1 [Cucurbita moschata]